MSEHVGKIDLLARERYAVLGVDTDAVLQTLAAVPSSLHCWQGDLEVAEYSARPLIDAAAIGWLVPIGDAVK